MLRIMTVSALSACLWFTVPALAAEKETGDLQSGQHGQALTGLGGEIRGADGDSVRSVYADMLATKSRQRLMEIATDINSQRQSMADFESFVTWMTANLSGYSRYIRAGSLVAGFARVLPIPYAGQASVLTKFITQGALSLNAASVSVSRYLATSRDFVARVDALEHIPAAERAREVANLSRLADEHLKRDMTDARAKLKAASELSASTLSFLESLNHYLGSGEEYWTRTKSLISGKDSNKEEKGYLAQNIQGLRNRAASFNGRLRNFEASTEKDEYLIASLKVYDELIREMSTRHASVGDRAAVKPGT